MVRYQGHAAMARLTVPFAREKPFDFPSQNIIDVKAAAKWRELGLVPSPPCTDAEFLRRAMLDAIGTTPTRRTRSRTSSPIADPDKRTKLVDRLLDRPEYVDFWTLKWGDLLRVNSEKLGAQGMLAFNLWLREAFRSNKPVDRMVEELVTAQGSIFSNGPANLFSGRHAVPTTSPRRPPRSSWACASSVPSATITRSRRTARTTTTRLAAYFARVRTKRSDEFGLFGGEQVVYVAKDGRGLPAADRQEDGSRGRWAIRPVDDPVDRRRALAKWLTDAEPALAGPQRGQPILGLPAGQGAGQPDRRPPRDQPALEPRAARCPGRRVRRLGLRPQGPAPPDPDQPGLPVECDATPDNRLDTTFFTHYTIKRLTAEQLLDAHRRGDRDRREVPAASRRHPGDLAAGHQLCVVLPRYVRPPVPGHRLRVRAVERPEPEPGAPPDERRPPEPQAAPGRAAGWPGCSGTPS